jgi:protein-tyrosine phosphatase
LVEILTVCTGNICRSPLAAQLLHAALADRGVTVVSAGTGAWADEPMTDEAAKLATARGVSPEVVKAHRARVLEKAMMASPDLVLGLTRDHRRIAAELAPRRVKSIFTLREFARLAEGLSDAEARAVADEAGDAADERVRAVVAAVALRRGRVGPPASAADDDVVDPFRRGWKTYELSAAQIDPAVDQVVRIIGGALDD